MIERRSRGVNRPGFTLIELLVVIAIIAILVSLTSAAVMRALWKVPEIQTSTDIAQLSVALQACMSDFDLSEPPPSTLVLNESAPLSSPSASFLTKMFGKTLGPTDWNGDGTIGGTWTLTGEQCLVFYTGGIPNTLAFKGGAPPQCLGFSYNKMNPTPVVGQRTHGPYFTFQSNRLVPLTTNAKAPNFYVYLDAWKVKAGPKPYAYFSSGGINNGYAAGALSLVGALPYFSGSVAAPNFMNPNTYQIISAGADGTFGGGLWNPSGGAVGAGADDQANFSSTLLKAGQQ